MGRHAEAHAEGGFTMLELIIVIMILGVVAATTVPTIAKMTTHSRVNQAVMVVAQDLQTVQSNAARERKPMRITRGVDKKSFTVTDRASGTTYLTRNLGSGDAYSLDSISFSTTPVDVFPNGFTSSALTLTLWAGGYSRQVTMSLVGWVRTK
jgi:prepilin-type N-terminal cleavage/methylation domain-containing protein